MSDEQHSSYDGRSTYRIYGLTISSELNLPQVTLLPDVSPALADVCIELGEVPRSLPKGKELASWIEIESATCLLRFEGIGRMLVEEGRRITVEKEPTATFDDLRAFLLGSGLGAIVHQRGLIPLHVSAVATPTGAIAFTGKSGAGKSTIAAHLNQEFHWPLICDDVAAVRRDQDRFYLDSGVNTVKLWLDALQSLNRTSDGLQRDLTRHEKFHAIEADRFTSGALALRRLVLLEWGREVEVERVFGRRAYQIALGAIYRPEFASLFHNRENVALFGMALAAAIEVYILERPKNHAEQSNAVGQLVLAANAG